MKHQNEYFYPFTRTHHAPEKLFEEYTMSKFNNPKYPLIINYLKGLSDFDRTIFLLNIEYNSLRLVAEETNCSYSTIFCIINRIKKEIKEII